MNPWATTSCLQHTPQGFQMYEAMEDVVSSSVSTTIGEDTHSQTLLYNLSILKEKIQQVQSLVSIVVSPDQIQLQESVSVAIAGAGTLIQEIIVAASSMMYAFQQVAVNDIGPINGDELPRDHLKVGSYDGSSQPSNEVMDDHVFQHIEGGRRGSYTSFPIISVTNSDNNTSYNKDHKKVESFRDQVGKNMELQDFSAIGSDIIELDASDLLAKYTHYCQVCGKGFKRDANLRMHMRAHGDEYKTNAALSNPMKSAGNPMGHKDCNMINQQRKYSCPQEGCRWNKKHAKFQPLKSVICVKNHYKRSHCPKMYVCNRCNRKQFSVLSDLRTHEKHCGDLKWQCSCGTTFSRKYKLMGHVALFVGHSPAQNCFTKQGTSSHNHGI